MRQTGEPSAQLCGVQARLLAENSFAITCAADDEDVQAHNADRLYLCKHLAGALYERFKSGLSDSIVMALSALNHKWWPDVVLKQDKL
jgi:hypothetical protein